MRRRRLRLLLPRRCGGGGAGVTELLSLPEEVVERCMASAHEQGRLPAKWYGPWSDLTDR